MREKLSAAVALFGKRRLIAGLIAVGCGAVGVVLPPEILSAVATALAAAGENGN